MGVPVVTRGDGDRFAAQHSVTHLTAIDLTDLIANDAEDYVHLVVALAADEPRRNAMKKSLRERMRASPVCDGVSFTRNLKNAYRLMWQRYCAGDGHVPIAESELL
jgi:protein O-GlcNAc transferase